jgi:hypothetical protein
VTSRRRSLRPCRGLSLMRAYGVSGSIRRKLATIRETCTSGATGCMTGTLNPGRGHGRRARGWGWPEPGVQPAG